MPLDVLGLHPASRLRCSLSIGPHAPNVVLLRQKASPGLKCHPLACGTATLDLVAARRLQINGHHPASDAVHRRVSLGFLLAIPTVRQ